MSSSTRAAPASPGIRVAPTSSDVQLARARRRAIQVTVGIAVASFALLVDLLLAGHTVGEEIWGPVTAAAGTAVGLLSLTYLAMRGRRRAARIVLYALWVVVAFLGFGGYNDHRLPRPVDTITDQRDRPPLAPLALSGIAIVGAVALRSGSKGE
jgi:peptidoglycan/LPS O-acetylase OafA/YrhL